MLYLTRPLVRSALLVTALTTAVAQAQTPAELVERSRAATRTDPDTSRRLAEQALALLAQRPDADQEIRARVQLCDYQSERDRALAQQQVEAVRALLPRASRPGLGAGLLTCEADLLENAGEHTRAVERLDEAITLAERTGEQELLANALYGRGYLRGVQGQLALGLADMRRATSAYESLGLATEAQNVQNGVAILYNRMGDHAQARHYFQAALKAQQAAGLTREQAVTQHNLGRVLENLHDLAGARRAYETVLALSREIGYVRGEVYGLRGLASVHNTRGEAAQAMALLDRAAPLQRQTPDERLRAQLLLQRGTALRGLQRAQDSLPVLQDALAVFRKADSMAEIVACHDELAASYQALGEWRAAYEQHVAFKRASDLLLQRQLDERFGTLKLEFDSAAKDKEYALLQRDNEASERALEQQRSVGRLQAVVLALASLLAALLASLAWRHRRASREMHTLAMTDELTGLPNRRHVLARFDAVLTATGGALLIVDLDHFKRFNDQRGHLVGDDILRAVAEVLRREVPEPMAIGRLGGEEFVIVCPRADLATAMQVAERVRAQVQAIDLTRWMPGGAVTITVSIGVTVSGEADSVSGMLRRADEALYAAKAAGRNRVVAHGAFDETGVAASRLGALTRPTAADTPQPAPLTPT
jgi:diguanylate cyclase (GGDEF)-like protein